MSECENTLSSPEYKMEKHKEEQQSLHIVDLPPPALVHIFSYLTYEEVKVFSPILMEVLLKEGKVTRLRFGPDLTTERIFYWLDMASNLQYLKLVDRNDVSLILDKVAACNPTIEEIRIHECYGYSTYINLATGQQCSLLDNCTKLSKLHLANGELLEPTIFNKVGDNVATISKWETKAKKKIAITIQLKEDTQRQREHKHIIIDEDIFLSY